MGNVYYYIAAAAKSLQSCPTLCDPIESSPPGSPIPGILQARTMEWVAISSSHAWKWKVKEKSLSGVRLLATPWTAAYQAPPSIGFSRQEYWSGVSLPSPYYHWFMSNMKWYIQNMWFLSYDSALGEVYRNIGNGLLAYFKSNLKIWYCLQIPRGA